MNSLVTKSLLAVTLLASLPLSARAGHNSYCYTGTQCGCHGETHMINALSYLDREYYDCHSDRYLFAAQNQMRLAYREVHSSQARWYLNEALQHLNRYRYNHAHFELDQTASLVSSALQAEQNSYRPIYVPYNHGHNHGSSYSHHGGYYGNRANNGTVIRFGNSPIGIRIGF